MEETKEQQGLYRSLQFGIYLSVVLEVFLFFYVDRFLLTGTSDSSLVLFAERLSRVPFYDGLINSKLFTLVLICLVSIGTLSRKKKDLNPKNQIVYPLALGMLILFSGVWLHGRVSDPIWQKVNWYDLAYVASAFVGAILVHMAMDNVSKIISSNLGKDRWNIEEESFMQPTKPVITPYSVNIPTLFYYKRKVRKGYIPLENLFRGCLVCGVPGSGKSFGVIAPIIRQMLANSFTLALYDLKYPDLGKIAYYHYLLAKRDGRCMDYRFHVINLNDPEKSRRVNPLKRAYLNTLADASETAEALVEALKKGDKSGGSDQFFTQSAVNFLAACIFFFSRYEDGRYSSLPHVLAFLNLPYEQIFTALFTNQELGSLLSPFMSAYTAKAFDQLEGQVGTLKIFISRLATKETFWVFGADDFELQVSNPKHPGILVLANDPSTQSINSACLSVVLNRVTKLINTRGNLPIGLVVDEAPSLYIHRVDLLVAQSRSNFSAVVLGLQELPMLRQQYGKETAEVITSIMGNVLSGSVRSKETLEWLERLFGKVKQTGESLSIDRTRTSRSLNEKLEPLIPAGKIASLKAGEIVGIVARDTAETYTGKYETSAVNCRINLDMEAIKMEEAGYRELPTYYDFKGRKEEILLANFFRINKEVQEMVNALVPHQDSGPAPQPKGTMKPTFRK
ncbi:type IV secretion system DNA-binding domain-containing protein [Sphingobacterium arenae]|uniref:Type IV secretion system DNA-binding domain-containing protein n=1 Tax=Sphingobacterium arenae TaxID=1280598 RepID=A0ABR7XYD2_9SPHI|nr:type IV secretion system DNA-binding domain-containing protein [Sphingobacterium arenae]MBD1424033.1 type IV secretion system DNA-binding domain-containing protein [Sphingobacterium arenae]